MSGRSSEKMKAAAKERWKRRDPELKAEIERKRIESVKAYWASLSLEERRERALKAARVRAIKTAEALRKGEE